MEYISFKMKMKLCTLFAIYHSLVSSAFASPDKVDGGRSLYNPQMAQIPDDILVCYSDRRMWDR